MTDPTDPGVMVELMELTATELERRGERMLKLSRDLLAQAMRHQTLAALPEERSLARGGQIVDEVQAIKIARELRSFTRTEFAEALGLTPSGVSRWLAKLIDREHPIIARGEQGGYAYIDPAPVTELRAERKAPGKQARATRATRGDGSGVTQVSLNGVHKDLRPIVRQAIADGWKLHRSGGGTGHWKLTRPGQTVSFACTPRNAGDAASLLRQHLARAERAVS